MNKVPLNILYLHESPYLGGAEKSILLMASNLDRFRFNPVISCPSGGQFAEEIKKSGIQFEDVTLPRIRGIKGVKQAIDKVREIVQRRRIDIIHGNGLRSNIFAFISGKMAYIPIVWHARNLVTRELVDPERLLAFLPDKILCNGTAIARRFSFMGKLPGNVEVVYTGVDLSSYKPGAPDIRLRRELGIMDDEVAFGIVGRLAHGKGHRYLIEAARDIISSGGKIKILVVGGSLYPEDSYMENTLKEMVKNSGIDDKVIFTGFRTDMPDIMRAIDVLVLATDAEPFGRSLLEAMASAKPVIATNSGGSPEIVSDGITGILVEPKDPSALRDAMKRFIEEKGLAMMMGEAGRKRASKLFDIKTVVGKVESIYEELASEKNRGRDRNL